MLIDIDSIAILNIDRRLIECNKNGIFLIEFFKIY